MRKAMLIPLAFFLGLLSYGVAGIAIARITGIGQFYSVPFGMMRVNDESVLMSLIAWIALWLLVLTRLLPRRLEKSGNKNP